MLDEAEAFPESAGGAPLQHLDAESPARMLPENRPEHGLAETLALRVGVEEQAVDLHRLTRVLDSDAPGQTTVLFNHAQDGGVELPAHAGAAPFGIEAPDAFQVLAHHPDGEREHGFEIRLRRGTQAEGVHVSPAQKAWMRVQASSSNASLVA